MTQEFYMKDEDDILRISRDSFKITLKLKGIASRLSVNDVKKVQQVHPDNVHAVHISEVPA